MTNLVVGIDLGTTNSAIAAIIDDKVQVIPVHGASTMPSAVAIDPSGRIVVGQAAKNQSISAPEATVLSIKRLMGTDSTVSLGGKEYRPEEISAIILSELKKQAELHLKQPVTQAVITVPAFFNERQRHATQDAGRIAGLEVLRIINEPTAAALAYGAGLGEHAADEKIMVYDLGGGTFDVSIVTVEGGVVEVLSSHGDTHLGGDDFDEVLVKEAAGALLEGANTSLQRRLKAVMEKAKIQLSSEPYVHVREEFVTGEEHLDTELDRGDYNQAILPFLERTLDSLQRALTDSGLTASALSKVLLVGGATRTPLVQEILRDRLGRETHHEVDPDLIVAMGAAIQGAALSGRSAPAILVDITPHSYSIAALNDYTLLCNPIIRRGTALPARKSEAYTTVHDNQTEVKIEVYQGESIYPEENLRIGEFQVTNLGKVPRGNGIVVTFDIDLNGLLTVTATEKSTGLAKSVTIDTGGQHRINLDTARASLAEIIDDFDADHSHVEDEDDHEELESSEVQPTELLASAKSQRRRATTMLEAGTLSESDTAAIRTELDAMAAAISASDWAALEQHTDKLSDLLFYLED